MGVINFLSGLRFGKFSTRKVIRKCIALSLRFAASISLTRKSSVVREEHGLWGVLSDQLKGKLGRCQIVWPVLMLGLPLLSGGL